MNVVRRHCSTDDHHLACLAHLSDQVPRTLRDRTPQNLVPVFRIPDDLVFEVKSRVGAQKIALFRSLFRGREDVYAQRWESPDGRSGYSPKTERDWKAYYAAKPEDRKRVDKETRKNIPLTDEAMHGHLAGQQTLGVYPLLLAETCWFLAVDFDKKTWKGRCRSVQCNLSRTQRARRNRALAFWQRSSHLDLLRTTSRCGHCPALGFTALEANDGAATPVRIGFL
jgi:hypothetical protein